MSERHARNIPATLLSDWQTEAGLNTVCWAIQQKVTPIGINTFRQRTQDISQQATKGKHGKQDQPLPIYMTVCQGTLIQNTLHNLMKYSYIVLQCLHSKYP